MEDGKRERERERGAQLVISRTYFLAPLFVRVSRFARERDRFLSFFFF